MIRMTRFLADACLVLILSSLAFGQSYTVTNLGNLGTPGGGALAINDLGHVAGFSNLTNGGQHAFLWNSKSGMRDLGTLPGGNQSYAYGMNDSDQVVGVSLGQTGVFPFLWTKGIGMQNLGGLGGDGGYAYSINRSGQVVGWSTLPDESQHAFLWTSEAGMQDLGTLGGLTSMAMGINDSGEVVGVSWLSDNTTTHAFLWTQSAGMQDLGTLPGGMYSAAEGINSLGQIVGWADTSCNAEIAVLWTANRQIVSLGTGSGGVGQGINNSSEVVGYFGGGATQNGFVWNTSHHLLNLGHLLPPNSTANAINNLGQIAATDTSLGAILLTPNQ
jgi:probable HAF family extracellular repeat protein